VLRSALDELASGVDGNSCDSNPKLEAKLLRSSLSVVQLDVIDSAPSELWTSSVVGLQKFCLSCAHHGPEIIKGKTEYILLWWKYMVVESSRLKLL
jgi:hypothetical protein